MKKALSLIIVGLLSFSMFSILAPRVKAMDVDAAPPLGWLDYAISEIFELWEYLAALHSKGVIDDYKYIHMTTSLNWTYMQADIAKWNLDTMRYGFDDLKEGMYNLYYGVKELEGLVKDIENWVKLGLMPSEPAKGIFKGLETIQMLFVMKAEEEAESEIMLAVTAIKDAEARGRSLPWLRDQISYIKQYLSEAIYWFKEGWLSKAVSYFKMAFYYSQRIVVSAWHWSWDITPEDWIDQLEKKL